MTGVAGLAAVFAYLCIPGHPLGTFFYNAAPPLFRYTVAYAQQNSAELWTEIKNHISVSLLSIAFAFGICFPFGIVASRIPVVRALGTNIVGVARGIPGIAVLFLIWPWLGPGERPTIIALTILAAPPIFLNTVAAYASVNRSVIEAARGMGLNAAQVLLRIETPLAASVVVAGLRIATIEVIASATIAGFVNFQTLGVQIAAAIQYLPPTFDPTSVAYQELAVGVGAVALIALTAELVLSLLQRFVKTPSA
jgi:osmoprotectant transport system permease protein